MSRLVFVDCETTGLDPRLHDIWEVAWIVRDGAPDREYVYQLRPDLSVAEPNALRIGRFYWRFATPREAFEVAEAFARDAAGAHLVAAVPSFDAAFLDRFLRQHGQASAWHYHLVDVEALAAGYVGAAPPWDSEELSRAVGVEPSDYERHTALGDARWARDIYDAVLTNRRARP